MKENPITIGFDDATFELRSPLKKTTYLIGVVCQGIRLVNVFRKKIEIDGNDATKALIELAIQNELQVQYILTDTITFGGFNIIDLNEVHLKTKKPVIAVTEREVDLDSVKTALIKRFPNKYKEKVQKIINAGLLYETNIKTAGGFSKVYFHAIGIDIKDVENLFQKTCVDSKLPESIRLAHIIGRMFLKKELK